MGSGIYRDLASNEDFVVFGGRIARSVNWGEDRKEVLLHFVVADKEYEVGESVSKATFNKNTPQVGLVFDNPKSVDILIHIILTLKSAYCNDFVIIIFILKNFPLHLGKFVVEY